MESNELLHYGTPRKSGRYPWGSGDNPYQHEPWFTGFNYGTYKRLKDEGLSEKDICSAFEVSSTELRKMITVGKAKDIQNKIDTVQTLKAKGMSVEAIAERTKIPVPTIRKYLKDGNKAKKETLDNTVEALKKCLEENKYIDVGAGTEYYLGVSKGKLQAALKVLKDEGYTVNTIKLEQVTNSGKDTTMLILGPKGATGRDIHNELDQVGTVTDFTLVDNGRRIQKVQFPESIDSSRVFVRYGDDEISGTLKDGTVEIRPGVADLTLGDKAYGQVRIMVDGDKYIKGMAYYSDDVPEGYDIVVNSNKLRGSGKEFKKLNKVKDADGNDTDEIDSVNPFGAVILPKGQKYYEDDNGKYIKKGNMYVLDDGTESEDGKKYNLSAINLIKEEGVWDDYTKSLSTQFLSKQSQKLVESQLAITYDNRKEQYDEICEISNPTIQKKMLKDFAEACDSDAVELKADPFPGQTTKVIFPANTLKDNEVYCPTLEDGTTVALVRYPHQGTFEIPILKVNNKNEEASKMLGNSPDALAINHNNAVVLSGADYDGDTVITIPFSKNIKIESTANDPAYKALRTFDPDVYARDYDTCNEATKQRLMGQTTNLLMDMTMLGANSDEIVRATKCCMIVIDAVKHQYDWKQCFKDNDILELKRKYQGGGNKGAGTLITRAGSEIDVKDRKVFLYDKDHIDPNTGEKIYEESGKQVWDGKKKTLVDKTTKSTKMAEAKDARDLMSSTDVKKAHPNEVLYADYANKVKALANEARKKYLTIDDYTTDKEAKAQYKTEVDSIMTKLDNALTNPPKERAAQVMATNMVKSIKSSGVVDKKQLGKESDKALSIARNMVGSSKKAVQISLTDKEWDAIESKAIGSATLNKVLKYVDDEDVNQHIKGRNPLQISDAKQARIRQYANQGMIIAEIAAAIGVSETTVKKYK